MNWKKARRGLLLGVATAGLFGCGPDGSGPGIGAQALSVISPTPTPTSTSTPTPTPTPTATTSSSTGAVTDSATGTTQMAKVADGLNAAPLLTSVSLASSSAPDVVGAFRFLCTPSHISYDDPIVHPGKPGANEHLHIFFGNTKADANSTYQSLRASGDSTCRNVLNRSAYWQPAMLGKSTSGQDVVIVEDYTNFYYKARPEGDPAAEGRQVAIPRGLKFVFGGMGHPAQFKCIGGVNGSWFSTMQGALAICSAGQRLDMMQTTPPCWDGKNLDSLDHRSHMALLLRDGHTGKQYCPSTHPYVIPQLTFQRIFTIRADDITSTWRLSSDMQGAEPGAMAHADYMMAWNDEVHERWMGACINLLRNCSDGNLGDGGQMIANELYNNGMQAKGRRVPLPQRGAVVSLLVQ